MISELEVSYLAPATIQPRIAVDQVRLKFDLHPREKIHGVIDWNDGREDPFEAQAGLQSMTFVHSYDEPGTYLVSVRIYANGLLQGNAVARVHVTGIEECGVPDVAVDVIKEAHAAAESIRFRVVVGGKYPGHFDFYVLEGDSCVAGMIASTGSFAAAESGGCAGINGQPLLEVPASSFDVMWPPLGWDAAKHQRYLVAKVRNLNPFGSLREASASFISGRTAKPMDPGRRRDLGWLTSDQEPD